MCIFIFKPLWPQLPVKYRQLIIKSWSQEEKKKEFPRTGSTVTFCNCICSLDFWYIFDDSHRSASILLSDLSLLPDRFPWVNYNQRFCAVMQLQISAPHIDHKFINTHIFTLFNWLMPIIRHRGKRHKVVPAVRWGACSSPGADRNANALTRSRADSWQTERQHDAARAFPMSYLLSIIKFR